MLKSRIEYAIKHYAWVQALYKFSMTSVFRILGLFIKTDPNLVLYNSMIGRSTYDSPKAIYDYLISHPEYAHLRHVWAFTEPDKVEGYDKAEKIKMDSLQYFKTALKAGYWITNVNIERGLKFKKKKTKYLNTWHGLSFNSIGNDVPGRSDYDSRNVDFICYESDYHKAILMRALRANEHSMLPSGLPRNDELYNISTAEITDLKNKLNLPLDKKIILYAPTWRDSEDGGKSYIMAPPINFKYWQEMLGDDYIVLLRTHHLTTKLMEVEFNDFLHDFSSYPKINDLFKISDILISDYSACIGDFAITEKPIICFAYDYDTYKAGRGLYIDFKKDLPIPMFTHENEIIEHIKTMNYTTEVAKTQKLKRRYCPIGGNATQICVTKLFNR